MLTLLLLTTAVQGSDGPLQRNTQYMKAAKDLSVTLQMTVEGKPSLGQGHFRVKPPKSMVYRMKWDRYDYSFSIAGTEVVAIERGTKIYREYADQGSLFVPESDISPVPDYGFPIGLAAGSVRAMAPGGIAWKPDGKKTVDGVSCDQIAATWAIQFGNITVRAQIDAEGRMRGYDKVVTGPNAHTVHMKIGGYKVNQNLPLSAFVTPIPLGFVPETLPSDAYPLNLGEKLPWQGWKPLAGGTGLQALAGKKVLFVAIAAPNCLVSQKASAAVSALAKKVESKGAVAAALSLDKSPKQAPVFRSMPNFYDPTGHGSQDLRAPGTPMFLLVAGNGRVTRIWYGFDTAKAGEFSADVLAWVEKSKKPDEYFKYLDRG